MIGAIIQARLGSERLPNKVLLPLGNHTMLGQVIRRVGQSRVDAVVVVSPDIELMNEEEGADYYFSWCRTKEDRDVLAEYYYAAKDYDIDTIIRITADCPCVDPKEIDRLIDLHLAQNVDYTFNRCDEDDPGGWIDGQDIEVFTFNALEGAHNEAVEPYDREHVTPWMRRNLTIFKVFEPLYRFDVNFNLSVNTKEDYDRLFEIFKRLPDNFTSEELGGVLWEYIQTGAEPNGP